MDYHVIKEYSGMIKTVLILMCIGTGVKYLGDNHESLTINQNATMLEMVKAGADPIQARCATMDDDAMSSCQVQSAIADGMPEHTAMCTYSVDNETIMSCSIERLIAQGVDPFMAMCMTPDAAYDSSNTDECRRYMAAVVKNKKYEDEG